MSNTSGTKFTLNVIGSEINYNVHFGFVQNSVGFVVNLQKSLSQPTWVVQMAVERLALCESRAGHLAILPQAHISVDGS